MRVERVVPGVRLRPERAAALEGSILTRDLVVAGSRWTKGTRLTAEEVQRLVAAPGGEPAEPGASGSAGSDERPITLLVLEPGDLHEDEAALRLAAAIAGPGLTQRGPSESRVDLLAATDGVLHVRTAVLERIDRIDPLEVFTRFDGQVVQTGDLVASVKVAPHVVPEELVERAVRMCGKRGLVWVAGFRPTQVGILVKQALHAPARERFEASVRQKVEALGSTIGPIRYVDDEVGAVTAGLAGMVSGGDRVDLVLTAGSASTDPCDPFYMAIDSLGGEVIRHGVPAHPGSMLWLAHVGRTDIIGLPTCGAYSKATAADLLLPRLLSGERADARTIARLGHGGVLARDMRFRMPPYARELEAEEG